MLLISPNTRRRTSHFCLAFMLCAAAALAGSARAGANVIEVVGSERLSPRMTELTVRTPVLSNDVPVRVILPAGYARHRTRRYPVVYLLPGTNNSPAIITDNVDVEKFSAGMPVIIVVPEGGKGSYYTNWFNGGQFGPPMWETFHIKQLIPFIDARYRTIPARRGRAMTGISMGGFGAGSYAARHPGLFAAVVSFSGAVNTNYPPAIPVVTASPLLDGGQPDAAFGPRATEEVRWRGHNPWDLAGNLRGLRIQVLTHNGMDGGECGSSDPLEMGIHDMSTQLHDRLTSLRVPHRFEDFGPGGHGWPCMEEKVRAALPRLMKTFAAPPKPPTRVRYRSIEPRYRAYGWKVAIRRPALEFSHLRRAGRHGFTLSGSGVASVRSPARTTDPGASVTLRIRGPKGVQFKHETADARGRIHVTVSLGPANEGQQYRPGVTTFARRATVRFASPKG